MTLLVAIVMPTAIIATFMPMVLADYTLNYDDYASAWPSPRGCW